MGEVLDVDAGVDVGNANVLEESLVSSSAYPQPLPCAIVGTNAAHNCRVADPDARLRGSVGRLGTCPTDVRRVDVGHERRMTDHHILLVLVDGNTPVTEVAGNDTSDDQPFDLACHDSR